MRGIYRWMKENAAEDWHARVEVAQGQWTDMSKAEYDARKIEPTFWALQEEDSWREGVLGDLPGLN